MTGQSGAQDRALVRRLRARAEKLNSAEPAYRRATLCEMLAMIALAVTLALMIYAFVFQIARVDGASMEPNFWTGERVFVDRLTYKAKLPERGEVIICRYNFGGKLGPPVIKRVIGLPGEAVSIQNGRTCVDGVPLDEGAYYGGIMRFDMEPVTVPQDCLFVMGDNRDVSRDSRSVGPVPLSNVIGKARWIIWPPSKFGTFPE